MYIHIKEFTISWTRIFLVDWGSHSMREYKDVYWIKCRFPKTKLNAIPPWQYWNWIYVKFVLTLTTAVYMWIMYVNSTILHIHFVQSLKFKRVSLNKTPGFPFWGLIICVDFDLRDSKKMENMMKMNKIIFQNKNIDIYKTG